MLALCELYCTDSLRRRLFMAAPLATPLSLSQASRNMGAVLILSLVGVMFGGSVLTWRIVNVPAYLASPCTRTFGERGTPMPHCFCC